MPRQYLAPAFALVLTLLPALAFAANSLPPTSADNDSVPWKNGESLTYLVSMAGFNAAQGTFTAHDKGDHWDLRLELLSRGLVQTFYPFTDYFWCELAKTPWRSNEYGEFRFEPNRTIKERTQIDYTARQGTREIWSQAKTKTFPIGEDSTDDIGTILYHLRTGPWKPGDTRLFHVYESGSEKEATAQCLDIETRTYGAWPAQPLLHLLVLPGKGTHHRGSLEIWITNDARRLPLHANAILRYGTFSIDLTKAETPSLTSR